MTKSKHVLLSVNITIDRSVSAVRSLRGRCVGVSVQAEPIIHIVRLGVSQ